MRLTVWPKRPIPAIITVPGSSIGVGPARRRSPQPPVDRGVQPEQRRRQHHRQRDDQQQRRAPAPPSARARSRRRPSSTKPNSPACASASVNSIAAGRRSRTAAPAARARAILSAISASVSPSSRIGSCDQAPEVDAGADGHEEQPEQQTLERREVGLELVAILRARQHHAGQERSERRRQPEQAHHQRRRRRSAAARRRPGSPAPAPG